VGKALAGRKEKGRLSPLISVVLVMATSLRLTYAPATASSTRHSRNGSSRLIRGDVKGELTQLKGQNRKTLRKPVGECGGPPLDWLKPSTPGRKRGPRQGAWLPGNRPLGRRFQLVGRRVGQGARRPSGGAGPPGREPSQFLYSLQLPCCRKVNAIAVSTSGTGDRSVWAAIIP